MIDFQLFIINLLCIIGVTFVIFLVLTYMNVKFNTSIIAIVIGLILVIAIYLWINIPQIACDVCNHNTMETMMNFNDETPKFEYEQDGLIVPENIHATIRTDINLDKFLKYGYMSKQLKAAMEYQKKFGGTNPPPSVTATSQIIAPYGDVVIPVDPVLLKTEVPVVPETVIVDEEEVKEEFVDDDDDVKIILFFSPRCGYCKDFMKPGGIWSRVVNYVEKYGDDIDIIEVNSEINPQMCREFNVSYYPCLMKVKNNNVYEFNAERTYENVKAFCMN